MKMRHKKTIKTLIEEFATKPGYRRMFWIIWNWGGAL